LLNPPVQTGWRPVCENLIPIPLETEAVDGAIAGAIDGLGASSQFSPPASTCATPLFYRDAPIRITHAPSGKYIRPRMKNRGDAYPFFKKK